MLNKKRRSLEKLQMDEVVTIGSQKYSMEQSFPNFKYFRKNGVVGWIGKLQPTDKSAIYTVEILYHPRHPRVYIRHPEVLKKAPHRYEDGRLCLYYPKDKSYTEKSIIAETIVPWTTLWLYYYEAWLEEGVWWGDEAPHSPTSSRGRRVNRRYR